MKLEWQVEDSDIIRVKEFYDEHKDSDFVTHRRKVNVERNLPEFSHELFWNGMVSCLLTTQQRSGPTSAVSRFISSQPFPLSYDVSKQQRQLESFARSVLADFGGIRRSSRLATEIQQNFLWLEERGGWNKVDRVIAELNQSQTQQAEVEAANFIDDNLRGFGPKQARNLLQGFLGLTKYEIPIDSRITKWLNNFGFPVRLSSVSLADRDYYEFVSEGFRRLCDACDIYPCLLDAAIFSSYD